MTYMTTKPLGFITVNVSTMLILYLSNVVFIPIKLDDKLLYVYLKKKKLFRKIFTWSGLYRIVCLYTKIKILCRYIYIYSN